MRKKLDPQVFGFHPSTRIVLIGKNRFVLEIHRKSRIVMKDGENILKKASKIKISHSKAIIEVETTAPVCSKTRAFLLKNGIDLKSV